MNADELRARLQALGPLPVGHFPTPLEPLPRLSAELGGPELWVKRDDQTGLGLGGNKVRKLIFLAAEALRQGADTLITVGAQQSNHVRQTAAIAAQLGLHCVAVLRGTEPSPPPQGNYLLDRLLGAEIWWAGHRPLLAELEAAATDQWERGRHPYVITYGGSSPVGVCGYVAAFAEFAQQAQARDLTFDAVVVASSSGGTQAGLVTGARALGYAGRIVGVSIDWRAADFRPALAQLANDTSALLGLAEPLVPDDFTVADGYLGGGYGVVGDLEREAIALAARTEGLFLDPVYTGRAFGGLVDLIHRGEFHAGQRVLFWHTGGTPALFAYAGDLL
jgi:D-cysteine desulfhydrase family pyridoxal phosphate-dependent enzyme